jgi:hypothetical protein
MYTFCALLACRFCEHTLDASGAHIFGSEEKAARPRLGRCCCFTSIPFVIAGFLVLASVVQPRAAAPSSLHRAARRRRRRDRRPVVIPALHASDGRFRRHRQTSRRPAVQCVDLSGRVPAAAGEGGITGVGAALVAAIDDALGIPGAVTRGIKPRGRRMITFISRCFR